MFNNLSDEIKALNADVHTVANCKKAKKLRKTLIGIGLPLAIVGIVGVFICIATFAKIGFSSVEVVKFSSKILIPFILIIPFAFMGAIGAKLASLGFGIVITGFTTNIIKEAVGNNCPNCGNTISENMAFCTSCGAKVEKECPNCKHVNDLKSDFCEKCGTKLN